MWAAQTIQTQPSVLLAVEDAGIRDELKQILEAASDISLAPGITTDSKPAAIIFDQPEALAQEQADGDEDVTGPALVLVDVDGRIPPAHAEPALYLTLPLRPHIVTASLRTAIHARRMQRDMDCLRQERDTILDNFSESFLAVDENWRITYMNRAAEAFVNLRREEALGKDAWSLFPSTADTPRAEIYRRAMRERVPVGMEVFSPEFGWSETTTVPFNHGGLGVYFRSATRVKAAEEAASSSERRLRLFLEHATDYALVLMDAEAKVVEWLGAAEAITGWSRSDMEGSLIDGLFTEEDCAAGVPTQELAVAVRTGRAQDTRWHLRKDGSRFYADGVTTAFIDEDGKLQGFGKVFRDATARRLADQRLRESRSQLQLILNSVADGIYTVDAEGHCTLINPSGASMLGYREEELLGRSLHGLIHHHYPDGRPYPNEDCPVTLAVTRGVPITVEDEVFWCKDGSALAVRYAVNPMREGEEVLGAVIAFTDITEKQRAQAALQDSERRLRLVMDAVPQKIYTTDSRGKVTYANPDWVEFAGMSVDELRSGGWRGLLHPDEEAGVLALWQECARSGKPLQVENRFRNAAGEYRWHLSRALPMKDSHGEILMWVGANTDIHDLKKTEVKLAKKLRSEQRRTALLSDLASASRAVNAVLSVEGIADILAAQARHILDVQRTTVLLLPDNQRPVLAISADENGTAVDDDSALLFDLETMKRLCADNQVLRLNSEELQEHPALRKTGADEKPLNGCAIAPLVGHREQALGFIQVCDRLDGEFNGEDEAILAQLAAIAGVGIENASLYDSLREQDRRKDEFLATLAHELRNPLAPLRTGLDLLKLKVGSEQAAVQDMMQRQLGHLVRLVDDLMDVSRVSRGKVELRRTRVEISTIINTALEAVRPLIQASGQNLSVHNPKPDLMVQGDITRLAQVVSNLLNNAGKYTPPNGRIELTVEPAGDQVHIRVSDTGIGISAEMLPRVFDLFTQAAPGLNQSQGGLGIGLSLVKQLVEMHGGTVSAHSEGPGRGSTFSVCLPLAPESGAAEGDYQRPALTPDLAGKRVLVVDDNKDAAEILAMLLEAGGHNTHIAFDGAQALESARLFQPDLVLLDIGLPDMDGYAVAAAMRQEPGLQDVVLIALTGWGSEEDRRRSREAGFDLHLTKPVSAETLSEALERFFPVEALNRESSEHAREPRR